MRGRLVARAALVAAVIAATSAENAPAQGTIRHGLGAQTLFPLREGNTWTYVRKGPAEVTEWTAAVTARVTAPRVHPSFSLEGYFPGTPRAVRSDPFGTVTERSDGFRDHLWYLLGAPAGTSWTLQLAPSPLAGPIPDCVSGAKLTLAARGETLSVPAGEFDRVVRVEWASACADAGISAEWFAPGIGLIRRDEVTIAGIVTSELVRAELGDTSLPHASYVTSLELDRPLYHNNLMPPAGPGALPTATGAISVAKRSELPLVLAFGGCKSVSLEIVDEAGVVVAAARGDDGGCCECRTVVEWDFSRGALVVPFAIKLADDKVQALPDGRYAVAATLETRDAEALRPTARAVIDIVTTH